MTTSLHSPAGTPPVMLGAGATQRRPLTDDTGGPADKLSAGPYLTRGTHLRRSGDSRRSPPANICAPNHRGGRGGRGGPDCRGNAQQRTKFFRNAWLNPAAPGLLKLRKILGISHPGPVWRHTKSIRHPEFRRGLGTCRPLLSLTAKTGPALLHERTAAFDIILARETLVYKTIAQPPVGIVAA
jgi:hypothetical protein